MYSNSLRTKIVDLNAQYLGVDTTELVATAAVNIAKSLLENYPDKNSFAFLCGLGNNGANGFATARELLKLKPELKIYVYLIGRQNKLKQTAAQTHWQKLRKVDSQNLYIATDITAPQVNNHEVFVECLVGTGLKGKLKKRMRDVLKRVTHFNQTIVALDVPVPGYSWDLAISNMYAKTEDAVVVDVGMPAEAEMFVGPGDEAALWQAKSHSYKSQNGKLLSFQQSQEFSLPEAAATYLGEHNSLDVNALNQHTDVEAKLTSADALYLHSSVQPSFANKAILEKLLREYHKPLILSGSLSTALDWELVKSHGSTLLVLSKAELPQVLGNKFNAAVGLKRFAAEHNCYLCVLGMQLSLIGLSPFTGKVEQRWATLTAEYPKIEDLAGTIAAYTTKNDIYQAMCGGGFIVS